MLKKVIAAWVVVKELYGWAQTARSARLKAQNKRLTQTVKEQKDDLDVAAMPCFEWIPLLDRLCGSK